MAKIPIYSYDDLRKKADDFLRTHNPSSIIPVSIEEIVEFEFNINIVPVLALQREFVQSESVLFNSRMEGIHQLHDGRRTWLA